jgi:hypothetical protein
MARFNLWCLWLSCLGVILCAQLSEAASVFYVNPIEFYNQASSTTRVEFSGFAPIAGLFPDSGTHEMFVGGLSFTDGVSRRNLQVVDPAYTGLPGTFPWALFGVPVLQDNNRPGIINVAFTGQGAAAAGMSISVLSDFLGPIERQVLTTGTMTLSDGTSFGFALDSKAQGFIGFTSNTPITFFSVSTSSFGLITSFVDYQCTIANNCANAPPAQVPETSSLMLLTIGIAGLLMKCSQCSSVYRKPVSSEL